MPYTGTNEAERKRYEFVEGLKVGDEVGVTDYHHNNPGFVAKVMKRTPTQLVVEKEGVRGGEMRFNLDGGRERTSGRARALVEPTVQFRENIERAGLLSRLSMALDQRTLERLSMAKLRALAAIIDPQNKEVLVIVDPREGTDPWEMLTMGAKKLVESGLPMPLGIRQEMGRLHGLGQDNDDYMRT